MQHVSTFAEIEEEFLQRVRTMVYCSAATIDLHQRPRSRVLHPIWDMSLAFIADPFKPIYVECRASWQNDPETRQRIWDLYKTFDVDLAVSWGDVESPT